MIYVLKLSHTIIQMPVIGSPFLLTHPLYRQLWFHMQRSWRGTRRKREERAERDEGKNCLCVDTVGHHVIHCEQMENSSCMPGHVCVDLTHLWVGQIHGPGEDDPLHYLDAGRRGQRAGVSVITVHRGRQQVPQDERPEVGLLFWGGGWVKTWLGYKNTAYFNL